jgi:hypothetical protein
MKNLGIILFSVLLCGSVAAQDPDRFIGKWDFTTVTGAIGYETGVMDIRKDSVITTFTGITDLYPSEWARYESDTFRFHFDVDGDMVRCYLTVKDRSSLVGYAKWDTGESVVNLTRKKEKK